MTVLALYEQLLSQGIKADSAQQNAAEILQKHFDELVKELPSSQGLLTIFKKKKKIKGVYLWGSVGRGKTFLMDLFFNSLPFAKKRRQHYQQFFKEIHAELKLLPKLPNPLPIVAEKIAEQAQILCIDEFHVDDITDAMIIHGLLDELVRRDVVLVMTSNVPIANLYLNGLQRDRFLPAIKLLQENMESVNLDGKSDYRIQFTADKERYHVQTENDPTQFFEGQPFIVTAKALTRNQSIDLNRRPLQTKAFSHDLIWINFSDLCGKPRSYDDYLELSARFKTVFLQDVPAMSDGQNDSAQRFIQLIDALYDRGARLVISAAAEPMQLYRGKNLAEPFKRTASRLQEMRSASYGGGAKK